MARTMVFPSDPPRTKDLVPRSPASIFHGESSLLNKQKKALQRQRQHVVIQTPPRPRALGDDIESPVSGEASAIMMPSSPRISMPAMSPKLSPISHASSTARQQEYRHRQQDLREPPSPFPPHIRQKQKHRQQVVVDEGQTSSNKSQTTSKNRFLECSAIKTDSSDKVDIDIADEDFVDLTDLFIMLQRRDWEEVYAFLKEHPKSSRQIIHSKQGISPLFHIVLRHGPPLPVVDMLLAHEAASKPASASVPSSVVWKQFDKYGRLPLHAACSCGPDARLDVISRLISSDPDALQMRTKDQNGRYPLHLAVVTNASEDVVMELMIHYPDASFKPDAHGKIPIEYAQDSCYGHNRLVVALEWAPVFQAASLAAYKRVAKATESKLNSLREAHSSYEEQLEDRYTIEKIALIKAQIQCNDELTSEKERNIILAEAMLKTEQSKEELIKEKDGLKLKLDRELLIRKSRTKLRDEELKEILLGKNEKNDKSLKGETNEDDNMKNESSCNESNSSFLVGLDSSSSKLPLPRLLKRISEGYETSKRRNELYKKSIDRQRASAQKQNALLATKENDLQQANQKSRCDAITLQETIDRAEDLAEKHQSTLKELSHAKEEVEKLKKIESDRKQRLLYSERRLKIQEKRLKGVQDLIESLKAAKVKDADRLDLIQEETSIEYENNGEIFENRVCRSSAIAATTATSPSTKIPKAADLSFDLSVEIEMAAMAAAHLDDSNISNCTSPSTRRREADLSVELAEVNQMDNSRRTPHGTADRETAFPEPTMNTLKEGIFSFRKQQTTNRKGKNRWDEDKGENWVRGTPISFSTTTVTTASRSEDDYFDDSMDRNMTKTPPVPRQVRSRISREYDQCSPLGTPKLDFTRDS